MFFVIQVKHQPICRYGLKVELNGCVDYLIQKCCSLGGLLCEWHAVDLLSENQNQAHILSVHVKIHVRQDLKIDRLRGIRCETHVCK